MPRRATTTCVRTMLLMSSLVALSVAGCGPSAEAQQRAKTREDFRDAFVRQEPTAEPTRTISHPKRILVAQGRSPVVFDVRTPATAHVMDLTAGTELVAVEVARDQWVSVNEDTGVLVGSRRVAPGPLPEGHEFGILLDVGGDESFQSELKIGAPPPPPRAKPATQPVYVPPASLGSQLRSN